VTNRGQTAIGSRDTLGVLYFFHRTPTVRPVFPDLRFPDLRPNGTGSGYSAHRWCFPADR